MDERLIMQRNLAQIFKGDTHFSNYASCDDQMPDLDPPNPFQKKIFEKRMRRSSVVSQNLNPNIQRNGQRFSQKKNVGYQCEYYLEEVEEIIGQTRKGLKDIEDRVKNNIRKLYSGIHKLPCAEAQALLQHLKFAMDGLLDYAKHKIVNRKLSNGKNNLDKPNDDLEKLFHEDSVCQHQLQKCKRQNPPSYFKNQMKFYQLESERIDCQIQSKEFTQQRGQATKSSLVLAQRQDEEVQDNSKMRKSVYQMVLEERKAKLQRRKKII